MFANRDQTLIITGVPRSGTSYLCNLLHRHTNCVALNEPVELSVCLRPPARGEGLTQWLDEMRSRINAGNPIRNKLHNGEVTEDTREANSLVEYCPKVASEDFLLAVKAPLMVLNHLDLLWASLPGVRVVACVRNPFDTIASWKTSFPHLQNADVLGVFRRTGDGQVDEARVPADLRQVANIPGVADRRAAWWAYLAGLILKATGQGMVLTRYEQIVLDPVGALGPILGAANAGTPRQSIESSQLRSRADSLDDADIAAIRKHCMGVAKELELDMGGWARAIPEAVGHNQTRG